MKFLLFSCFQIPTESTFKATTFFEYKNAMCFLFTNLIAYDAVLQMVKISLSIANATSNGAIINEMYYLFRIFNSVQLIDQ